MKKIIWILAFTSTLFIITGFKKNSSHPGNHKAVPVKRTESAVTRVWHQLQSRILLEFEIPR